MACRHDLPVNGGVLSTAGNLVFQGTATGEFRAYSGKELWRYHTGSSVQAGSVSYFAGGEQYILLPVGAGSYACTIYPGYGAGPRARGPSRLLAYKVGGDSILPQAAVIQKKVPKPPAQKGTAEDIEQGRNLHHKSGCYLFHGADAESFPGFIPDLRHMAIESHAQWLGIVIGGSRRKLGMLPADWLSLEEAQKIHQFIIHQSQNAWEQRPHPATKLFTRGWMCAKSYYWLVSDSIVTARPIKTLVRSLSS